MISVENLSREKNGIWRIESASGVFAAKVFPKGERGYAAAKNEFVVGREMQEFANVPQYHWWDENIVVMDCIESSETVNPQEAYQEFKNLMIKTAAFQSMGRVSDDCSSKSEFLNNFEERLLRLKLTPDWLVKIEIALSRLDSALDFQKVPSRFILSDFSPSNVVKKDGVNYLIDFEHAGMGDPYRCLCNLVLHPKSAFSREDCENLALDLQLDIRRLALVFPFSFMEWVLILLNHQQWDEAQIRLDALLEKTA